MFQIFQNPRKGNLEISKNITELSFYCQGLPDHKFRRDTRTLEEL